MKHYMDMGAVVPGDGYTLRKGEGENGGEVQVNKQAIARCGGVVEMTKRLVGMWLDMDEHYRGRGWGWYDEGCEFATLLSETYGFTLWQVAQVISVLSPQNPWAGAFTTKGRQYKDGNRLCTLNVIVAFCEGGEDAVYALRGWGYAPMFLKKAIVVMQGGELDWSKAPKTHRFALLLANPKLLDTVVCDSHASRIATGNLGNRYHVVSPNAYPLLEKAYIDAAAILGIPAYVLQAGTWCLATDGGLY